MTTTEQAELKACPFCGGEAELDTAQGYRALADGSLGDRAVVYCTKCEADMGFCYDDAPGTPREDAVNQVVDEWNRRAPDSRLSTAMEALREIAENADDGLPTYTPQAMQQIALSAIRTIEGDDE